MAVERGRPERAVLVHSDRSLGAAFYLNVFFPACGVHISHPKAALFSSVRHRTNGVRIGVYGVEVNVA